MKIADPYFGPEELWILKMILEAKPDHNVQIVTSMEHLQKVGLGSDWEEAFRLEWEQMSIQEPPYTEVIVAGIGKAGRTPFHDRWCFSDRSGLRFGTSLNSIGKTKQSEISLMTQSSVATIEERLERYFQRKFHEINGERVRYKSFTL